MGSGAAEPDAAPEAAAGEPGGAAREDAPALPEIELLAVLAATAQAALAHWRGVARTARAESRLAAASLGRLAITAVLLGVFATTAWAALNVATGRGLWRAGLSPLAATAAVFALNLALALLAAWRLRSLQHNLTFSLTRALLADARSGRDSDRHSDSGSDGRFDSNCGGDRSGDSSANPPPEPGRKRSGHDAD